MFNYGSFLGSSLGAKEQTGWNDRNGMRRRSATFETYRNPPLDLDEEFASAQIAEAVLYWPYVSKVHGIDIAISANEPIKAR